MFQEIFEVLKNLIIDLVGGTIDILIEPVIYNTVGKSLNDYNINIVLFSDTPILASNAYELTVMVFTFFFSMFFIILLYKTTKKIIKSVFGVLKWW